MAESVDPQAVAEVGHAVWDEFGPAAEQNWKLRWPQSIRTYARMAREDSQVKSVLKAVSLPVRRTTWRIDPNGADPEVVRLVAEDLRLPVLGDDGGSPTAQTGGHASFAGHLKWVLKMLVFGHAYFEVVFREQNGQDRLWKLAYRPPESIAEIRVERDGGLAGIRQHPAPGDKVREINIPVQHLLAYVNDPMDFSWRGESELRAASKTGFCVISSCFWKRTFWIVTAWVCLCTRVRRMIRARSQLAGSWLPACARVRPPVLRFHMVRSLNSRVFPDSW